MRNRARLALALIIMIFLLVSTGCGNNQKEPLQTQPVISIQDDFGRTIVLEKVPERIVSISPAHTEMLFALGLDKKVVGVTDYCDYPAGVKNKEKIGGYMDPNLEKIVALKPDLVVADSLNQDVVKGLEKASIPVIALNPKDVREVLKTIGTIGKATGTEEEARALAARINKQIKDVQDKLGSAKSKPRVYYEIWNEPLMAAGPGTVIDDLINLAGGTNVAADAGKEYPEYSSEVLIKKNPQVLIHSYGHGTEGPSYEQIIARTGWQSVDCIRNKQIYEMDANVVTRPGPRIGEALELIAGAIHPELQVSKGDK